MRQCRRSERISELTSELPDTPLRTPRALCSRAELRMPRLRGRLAVHHLVRAELLAARERDVVRDARVENFTPEGAVLIEHLRRSVGRSHDISARV